ncbi:hypothetical protein HYDPIDRAFT_32160 [Hydnomerulius pinastri MD-312]|uniref:Unplaced genomic scaffold scaffold_37, whole genome shotgun sequence n=1 Tax=Hydnomerulius pinastri MD-312 TaxID=994086 RepID=A0A0C9V4R4_9AGAM|nr:hypothetical protein HYDPIDRAFT_32160 [Hydnomerulius pinastri MD-312]
MAFVGPPPGPTSDRSDPSWALQTQTASPLPLQDIDTGSVYHLSPDEALICGNTDDRKSKLPGWGVRRVAEVHDKFSCVAKQSEGARRNQHSPGDTGLTARDDCRAPTGLQVRVAIDTDVGATTYVAGYAGVVLTSHRDDSGLGGSSCRLAARTVK